MENASAILMALVPGVIILRGLWRGCDPYAAFVRGAGTGLRTAVQVIPSLAAMMLMLEMLSLSGLDRLLTGLLSPVTAMLSLPEETAPLLVLRPLTGSGSLSVLETILAQHGPDSRTGMIASVLAASTETVFYTLTVYLSAAGIRRLPWVVPVSLLSGIAGAWVCGLIL